MLETTYLDANVPGAELLTIYDLLDILSKDEAIRHDLQAKLGDKFDDQRLQALSQKAQESTHDSQSTGEVLSDLEVGYLSELLEDAQAYIFESYLSSNESIDHAFSLTIPNWEDGAFADESINGIHDNGKQGGESSHSSNWHAGSFKVRTIDGTHNNGDKGASESQLIRLLGHAYQDGYNTPRGGDFSDSTLPNPRHISNTLMNQSDSITNFLNASDWLWQWGQFLDHDLDLNEGSSSPPEADKTPILVPEGDPYFPSHVTELPFTRVAAADGTGGSLDSPREAVNHITAYIDASNVYGSDDYRAEWLRDRSIGQGLLKTSWDQQGKEVLLPKNDGSQGNAGGTGTNLYVAGDVRANEQIGLTAVHTLFVREHNRIARQLYQRYKSGDHQIQAMYDSYAQQHADLSDAETLDNYLYESARKVVGAEIQAITYNEFLPLLIGEETLANYQGYQSSINPQISNEFANAAYRLGHTLLSNELQRVDSNGVKEISLHEAFFNADHIEEHGIEQSLTGLIYQGAQELDHQLVDSVRNFLFRSGGLDLASVNIARGRDVGLPNYTEAYQEIFGQEITDFSDLTALGLMTEEVVELLQQAYETVDQIDLWVGGVSESAGDHGGLLGPTFSYFIADQFERTRDGDKYFYLEPEELQQLEILAPGITDIRLSDVIKQNSENEYLIPDDVFKVPFDHRIFGDDTANILWGSHENDLIDAKNGQDHVLGLSGHDTIFGGDMDDVLYGHSGRDKMFGGQGNDLILGGKHADVLEGQAGNDTMIGGGGSDMFVYHGDILNDGMQDLDTIFDFQQADQFDFTGYVKSGGSISYSRVAPSHLMVFLGEDAINVFGSWSALQVAETQVNFYTLGD